MAPGHYHLGRELARGGMGRILEARDLRLGRTVALKQTVLPSPGALQRFEREARITARLQHPAVVSVHEAGIFPDGDRFFSMALIHGCSLHEVIADATTLPARLALLPHVLAVADAMTYAHGEPVDARADVYAIGVMLYHLLSGRLPYDVRSAVEGLEAVKLGPPAPLEQRVPGVPTELAAIVARAMARDALARYPTAKALAEDLRRYQTGQLVGAHHYSLRELMGRWLQRHRAEVSVAGVAFLVLLAVGVVALQRIVRAERLAEVAWFRQALRLDEALAEKDPGNLSQVAEVAVSHEKLAAALFASERRGEGLAELARAQGLTLEVAARSPQCDLSGELVTSLERVGDTCRAQKALAEAREAYVRALALAKRPGFDVSPAQLHRLELKLEAAAH